MKKHGKDSDTKRQERKEHKCFEKPELKYIEPKLTKQGNATNITFSAPFSPIPN